VPVVTCSGGDVAVVLNDGLVSTVFKVEVRVRIYWGAATSIEGGRRGTDSGQQDGDAARRRWRRRSREWAASRIGRQYRTRGGRKPGAGHDEEARARR
jgi:hypothetical protein